MIGVFQVIKRSTGERSDAVSCERDSFARGLVSVLGKEESPLSDDDYVLCLIDDCDDEEWRFSKVPLLTVRTFVDAFCVVQSESVE